MILVEIHIMSLCIYIRSLYWYTEENKFFNYTTIFLRSTSANGRLLDKVKMSKYTIAQQIDQVKMCVMIPKAKEISNSLKLYKAFKYRLWISLLLSLAIIALINRFVYYCINKIYGIKENYNVIHSITILFETLLSKPVHRLPTNTTLRLIFIFWSIFTYILATAYLEQYKYEPDLWGLLGQMTIKNLTLKDASEDITLWPPKQGFLLRSDACRNLMIRTIQRIDNRPFYHRIPDYPWTGSFSHFFQLGSAYVEKFNYVIRALFEGGFLRNWQLSVNHLKTLKSKALQLIKEENNDPEVITVNMLVGTFILYISGCLICFIVFIAEVLWYNSHT
ncbi:uncharacterized protein LOC129618907 [Condylostylus longicornis]|uniref:uncharacterized protein LOC129618907 n=1 Tax=Condylostylus longicornis TaxID=2530218 RepID=UPI00244E0594|nr:uncharacterized protein LOC129618907 [Condylostylus longicornis]